MILKLQSLESGGTRAGKGLADSRPGVGDNPRGTPKPRAREKLGSGRKTVRSTVFVVRDQGPPEARDAGKESGQGVGKER